jgi:hypothetical protein
MHPAVALLSSGVDLNRLGEASERLSVIPITGNYEDQVEGNALQPALSGSCLSPLIQAICSSFSRPRVTIRQTCSMGERSISSADENARTPTSADCNRLSSDSRLVPQGGMSQRNALHGHYCRRGGRECQLYVGIGKAMAMSGWV